MNIFAKPRRAPHSIGHCFYSTRWYVLRSMLWQFARTIILRGGAKNFCDGCLCQPQVHTVILIFRLIHAKHNDILTAHFASSAF